MDPVSKFEKNEIDLERWGLFCDAENSPSKSATTLERSRMPRNTLENIRQDKLRKNR